MVLNTVNNSVSARVKDFLELLFSTDNPVQHYIGPVDWGCRIHRQYL